MGEGKNPRPSTYVFPSVAASRSRQRIDDQLAGVGRHAAERLAEQRAVVAGHVAAPAGYYGNVLLTARAVGDHTTVVAQTIAGGPQLLTVVGGQRVERAISTGDEHQTALRGQQAGQRRILELHFPLLFAGHRIAGLHRTEGLTAFRMGDGPAGAEIGLAGVIRRTVYLLHIEVEAPFLRDLVVQTGTRVVCTRVPGDGTIDSRAHALVHAELGFTTAHQLAGLGVDTLDEVVGLADDQRVLDLELLVGSGRQITVVHEVQATLVGMEHV